MKRVLALALALVLLAGCAPEGAGDGKVHILCATYPVYLFTTAVTGGDEVEVELLVNQQTSCLHDYTLTVADMRAIDRADIIILNGGGLEAFLDDALAQKDVPVIDCSAGLPLLPAPDQHPGEDQEFDPHYWMDPTLAAAMVENIAAGLDEVLPHPEGGTFLDKSGPVRDQLAELAARYAPEAGREAAGLITFHDGFQYFANAFGLDLLKAIEEEEGAEASARELEEVIALVRENHIPAIFVEKNGSRRSADVIARETGCKVYELDMMMSGEGQGVQPYLDAMEQNLDTLWEALG